MCYPVLNLRRLRVGIRDYICALEQSVISAVQQLGVTAHHSQHTGVWVGEKKLGAIGRMEKSLRERKGGVEHYR